MEIGDSAITKVEEYFGRGWTRLLLIIGYATAVSFCLPVIVNNVVLPVYKVWRTPSFQTVLDSAQDAGSSVITTIFLTVLIIYLLIDMPRQARVQAETKALLETIEIMRDSRSADTQIHIAPAPHDKE